MYKIKLPKTVNLIIVFFRVFGLWDFTNRTAFHLKALKTFHFSLYLSFVASFLTKAIITDDPDDVVQFGALSIIVSVHAYRVAYIIIRQNDTIELIDEVCTHSTDKIEEFNRVSKRIGKFIKFIGTFIVGCTVEVSMFIIAPAVWNEMTLVKIAFPFGDRQNVFWIRQVFLLTGGLYSVLSVCFSAIIWFLMVNASIKYDMLGNQLRNLGERRAILLDFSSAAVQETAFSKEIDQEVFASDLVEAIKIHHQINKYAVNFEGGKSLKLRCKYHSH